jgi:hypothetical protein
MPHHLCNYYELTLDGSELLQQVFPVGDIKGGLCSWYKEHSQWQSMLQSCLYLHLYLPFILKEEKVGI